MANLAEILRHSCEYQSGVGNSFQPAIDASRFFLTDCVIAPSANMECAGFRWPIYTTIKPNSDKGYGRNQTTAETSPSSSLKFLACEPYQKFQCCRTRNCRCRHEIGFVEKTSQIGYQLRHSADFLKFFELWIHLKLGGQCWTQEQVRCRLVLQSSLIMELHIRLQTNSSTSYQRKGTHTCRKERKKKFHQPHSNSYEVFQFGEMHINKNWVRKIFTRCGGSREDWHRCKKFHRKLARMRRTEP